MSRGVLGAGCALVILVSCIDLSTDAKEIVAVQMHPLPWPSVVAGDTLRDSTGLAATVGATFFDGAGDSVAVPNATLLSRDTTVTIVAGNFVIGGPSTSGAARLFVSGGGLQSDTEEVQVVQRPDSLVASSIADTLRLAIPDDPNVNLSVPLSVRALSIDSLGVATGVRSWIVDFDVAYQGATVAPADTSLLFLENDVGRPSRRDTTASDGTATRRLRFKVVTGHVPQLDSVLVTATASYKGVPLRGSPIRFVIPVKPK